MKEAKLDSDALGKTSRPRPSNGEGVLGGIRLWPSRTKSFLGDVRAELKRVSWPTFTQIRATTVVVIITVFLFGIYFGILDWIFNNVVQRILQLGS